MAKPHINKYGFNTGRSGYSTLPRFPIYKTERRIRIPEIVKRPIRFQVRTLIRHELLRKDVYWFTLHRRGPGREHVGIDPLEARAVPESLVRGTLPERILWKFLAESFHMVPGMDFIFQSSLQGGRINLGGIVADFVFPFLMMVIQVDGPTHVESLRIHKDDEQDNTLNEMGYQVYHLPEDDIFNETTFNNWMNKTFGWMHSGGADSGGSYDIVSSSDGFRLDRLYESVKELQTLASLL